MADAVIMQKMVRKACESWLPIEDLISVHEEIWAMRTDVKNDARKGSWASSVSSVEDAEMSEKQKVMKRRVSMQVCCILSY